jgi:phenylalanyl-tRNA synthetase beta subunit
MPSEVADKSLFLEVAGRAKVCRVVRMGEEVKLKLRTPRRLYTMKVKAGEAEDLLKQLKCEIVEFGKKTSTPRGKKG